jgi:hypothetical protein
MSFNDQPIKDSGHLKYRFDFFVNAVSRVL